MCVRKKGTHIVVFGNAEEQVQRETFQSIRIQC